MAQKRTVGKEGAVAQARDLHDLLHELDALLAVAVLWDPDAL